MQGTFTVVSEQHHLLSLSQFLPSTPHFPKHVSEGEESLDMALYDTSPFV
jgi:hypothetical protein